MTVIGRSVAFGDGGRLLDPDAADEGLAVGGLGGEAEGVVGVFALGVGEGVLGVLEVAEAGLAGVAGGIDARGGHRGGDPAEVLADGRIDPAQLLVERRVGPMLRMAPVADWKTATRIVIISTSSATATSISTSVTPRRWRIGRSEAGRMALSLWDATPGHSAQRRRVRESAVRLRWATGRDQRM